MSFPDAVSLARKLIKFNTVNPPGNEMHIARFTGSILADNGFRTEYIPYGEERLHMVAEKGCSGEVPPVVFSGHFDTVPLGNKTWSGNPFGGEVRDGKLYGLGSSDMKGGLAAMVVAAVQAFEEGNPAGGVRLVFTAGEEFGCQGARHLTATYDNIGRARGVIIGEPTANIPAIGHKGGLYLNLTTSGIAAHSSMPHLGDNAVYKAARAITKIEKFGFGVEEDPILGFPTINVGKVFGGMNINSVPDHAGFTIDARTTSKVSHTKLLEQLKKELGNDVSVEILVDLQAVVSDEKDPFVQMVYSACGIRAGDENHPRSLPYLTDGSVLQPAYGGVPVVILGPGQPEMAHKTDEFCFVENIEKAVGIYKNILLNAGR